MKGHRSWCGWNDEYVIKCTCDNPEITNGKFVENKMKLLHENCGGHIVVSDNAACGDDECCGPLAWTVACQKCKEWEDVDDL